MQLVHCLLFGCTLFIVGKSESNQQCERFDGYGLDLEAGEFEDFEIPADKEEATCCAYCIHNMSGCTAYVFIPVIDLCYFTISPEPQENLIKKNRYIINKAGILRQSIKQATPGTGPRMDIHHLAATSPGYMKRVQVAERLDVKDDNSIATYVVSGVVAFCMLLVAVVLVLLTVKIRKQRMELAGVSKYSGKSDDLSDEKDGFTAIRLDRECSW